MIILYVEEIFNDLIDKFPRNVFGTLSFFQGLILVSHYEPTIKTRLISSVSNGDFVHNVLSLLLK